VKRRPRLTHLGVRRELDLHLFDEVDLDAHERRRDPSPT
jgi:hypothetical protein